MAGLAEVRLLDLADEAHVCLPLGLALLGHHDHAVDPPAALLEVRGEPLAELRVRDDDHPPPEPLCLLTDRLGIGFTFDPQEVRVEALRQVVVEDGRADRRALRALAGHVRAAEEGVGPGQAVSHRPTSAGA